MTSGVGPCADAHGSGGLRVRYRPTAAATPARGMVAVLSVFFFPFLNQNPSPPSPRPLACWTTGRQCSLTFKAYHFGNVKCGVLPAEGVLGITAARRKHFVEEATRSPGLNSYTFLPTLTTSPATSSPVFPVMLKNSPTFQSLGFEPLTTTLIRTWSSLDSGTGELAGFIGCHECYMLPRTKHLFHHSRAEHDVCEIRELPPPRHSLQRAVDLDSRADLRFWCSQDAATTVCQQAQSSVAPIVLSTLRPHHAGFCDGIGLTHGWNRTQSAKYCLQSH
ncbi:hypothetical protein MAPG_10237 [Magnaporthiopsis poae ATCC 64411]|uniref:Uncharacterized protein n=1 Tax=Magnaporthiopsis poae (strain ATCC 64411 / 73-15) TaxID=644358 RepID=A0A0C4EC24_MAGP6|nr:hypothetical protein MAPG_10237 [Magnaporthiopsis poae ATCC 64411]